MAGDPLAPDGQKIRAFVAIEPPMAVQDALARLQGQIREYGFRAGWTRPENIHLTLKFLGDTPVAALEAISEKMALAVRDLGSMRLQARSVGVFPGARHARVLWTGIGGDIDRLAFLQANLENGFQTLGYAREGKRFAGHFTLARFKGPADPEMVVSVIERFGDFSSEPFAADAIHLFESRLSPKGATYIKRISHRLDSSL